MSTGANPADARVHEKRDRGPDSTEPAPDAGISAARDLSLLRSMWVFVRPYKRQFFLSLAILPAASAALLVQPWIVKHVVDEYITVGITTGLWRWALVFFCAVVVEFCLLFAQHYITMLFAQKALADLRTAVFRHLQGMDNGFFERNPVGKLVTRVSTDVDVIQEMFAAGAVTMIMDAITLTGILVILLALHWKLTLVALAALPVMALLVDFFRRKARRFYRLIRDRVARINAYLQESLSGISVIQMFTREERSFAEFDELNSLHRDANHRSNIYEASLFSIVEAVSSISTAGILWYGAHLVLDEPATPDSAIASVIGLGTLVAFMEYINRFFIPVRDFSTKYAVLQSAIAACEKVFGVLELKPEIEVTRGITELPAPAGTIEFRDVTFSYIPGEPVLKNISFRAAGGEHLALVGATGSGKTTITKLLARFYDPDSGSVLVDGVDVREWAPKDLRRRIGVVLQDVFLFSETVEWNISLGNPEITPEAVRESARMVHVDRFVEQLPEGYLTPVHERGSNFSTGQRQLLSFARALVHEPEILVLDEATSSVDPETEELIQEALDVLQKDRTSLVIAHRLSTIEHADRILVLHHGELREQGTHAELLEEDGIYARLYRLQHRN